MDVKKVLVFGTSGSMKITALENICSKIVHTIALDYGNTIIEDTKIHFFSPPADEKFEFMSDVLSKNVDGVIIFADKTEVLNETEIMNSMRKDVPHIVVTNVTKSETLKNSLQTLLGLMSPVKETGNETLCHS